MAKKTKVFFRMFNGDVIALFPDLDWDTSGNFCTSYEQIGQHGSADFGYVMAESKPATPDEYAPIMKELEGIGYRLKVCVY